jgi:O-antigen ligase
VSSAVRPGEVRAFAMLLVGLGTVTALGTIYEYRTGTNLFYDFTDKVLPGTVVRARENSLSFDETGRRGITGPTAHGLAVTTMLSFVVPLALMAVRRARELRPKIIYAAITAILLAGSISTVRKSAAIVPMAGFVVLALYRPRAMVRLAPLLAVLVVVVHLMAPGAMGQIKSQLFPKGGFYNSPSVQGRTSDYPAVQPDLKNHPILGRGYGTYDPDKYRLLDNQYLGLKISTGWLGYSAYVLLLLSVALIGHQVVRTRDPSRGPPALAAVAAAASVGVASKLFDVLAFPQVPYVLLFLAALTTAAAHATRPEPSSSTRKPVYPTPGGMPVPALSAEHGRTAGAGTLLARAGDRRP